MSMERRGGAAEKPLLMMPIETKAREFPARVFLAGNALERGFEIIMGQSKVFHREPYRFPRGLVFENDASPRSYEYFRVMRQLGWKMVAWDEESLVTFTDDIYATLRTDLKSVEALEYFFCRGDGDQDAVARLYPDQVDKLIPVGNARMDVLYPKWFEGGAKVPPRDQKMILINSRFSIVNPYYVSVEQARENVFRKMEVERGSETGQLIDGWLDHAAVMFRDFAALTRRICEDNPDCRVVIRPHPSENHDFWKDLAQEYENAEMIYEGAASDWFLRADVLVHNSCTTALEAALVGLPSFAYLPYGDHEYEADIANNVGRKFNDMESMLAAIKAQPMLNEDIRQATSQVARDQLSGFIACIRDGSSAKTIIDTVSSIRLEPFDGKMLQKYIRNFISAHLNKFRKIKRDLAKGKDKKMDKARAGYASQKFPGITCAEVSEMLTKYGFSGFEVTPYHSGWVRIKKKKNAV